MLPLSNESVNSNNFISRGRSLPRGLFLSVFIILLLFSGCGTFGYRNFSSDRWLGMMPPGGDGYLFVGNMEGARPFVEWAETFYFGQEETFREIMGRTEKIGASFSLSEEAVFTLLLAGRYNSFGYGVGLAFADGWEQVGAPARYYAHKASGIKVAIPDSSLILMTNGDMENLLLVYKSPKALKTPAYLLPRIEASDGFLYFPEFAESAVPPGIPFNKKRLPVKEALITTSSGDSSYNLSAIFNLQDEKNSSRFLSGLKTFLVWLLKEADVEGVGQKLKSVDARMEKEYVAADNLLLSYGEIWEVLKVFDKSSDQPE